jgi:catechol 2,3-dioxygenase-like lactoylglutathione lyase family enzyme
MRPLAVEVHRDDTLFAMATALLGLRTVIYPSPDLDAAKAWWTQLLGFEPYFDEPFFVGYNVAGYELGLLPDGDPSDGALTYWGVEDVEAAVAAAMADGAIEHGPVADVGDGIITATVRTPTGAILGFIYNPHFVIS